MTYEADHDLLVRIDERVGAMSANLEIVTDGLRNLEGKVTEHIGKEEAPGFFPPNFKIYAGIMLACAVAVGACVGEILRRWHP